MSERDRLLRAAVFAAHGSRPLPPNAPAVQLVVDIVELWPLIAYRCAIDQARAAVDARVKEELDWYRSIGIAATDAEIVFDASRACIARAVNETGEESARAA